MSYEKLTKFPFIFVGMPGVGKTAASEALAEIMKSSKLDVITVDKEVKKRLKDPDDPILKEFLKKYPFVNESIFKKEGFRSADLIKHVNENKDDEVITLIKEYDKKDNETFGEELWRELEGDFLVDIMENEYNPEKHILDIGGKMFLRANVRETAKAKGIVPIFLHASVEYVLKHLRNGDNWKTRSKYRNAGKDGWEALAKKDYEERIRKINFSTDIGIAIDASEIESKKEEIEKEIRKEKEIEKQDLPKIIATEVLFSLAKYQKIKEKQRLENEIGKISKKKMQEYEQKLSKKSKPKRSSRL